MKQFYELYADNEKVSPLVTQLSWTNHLLIMSGAKSDEEREFYMHLAIKERYSKRELERQIQSAYYERYMLSKHEERRCWHEAACNQMQDMAVYRLFAFGRSLPLF